MSTREPSAKRQRTNDNSTSDALFPALASEPERIISIQDKIRAMKPEAVQERAALFVSLDTSGQFSLWMEQHFAKDQANERAQTFNFAKYVQKADYVLNEKYDHLSGSRQFDASGDAQGEVEDMLDKIVAKTKKNSNYATKKSAVETMRLIFETMLEASGEIGRCVRRDCYGWDAKFLKVMGTFTEGELEQLANEDEAAWVKELHETVGKVNGYCILERLQESLDDLKAYQAGGDSDEDEVEEDEDEDED